MVSLFADTAILESPDGRTIAGRENMLQFAEDNFANGMVDLLSENKCFLVEGRLAVDSGICTIKMKDGDGNLSEARATYMMVYRRGEDGRWLIERDTATFLA
jgi:ketosteroid isomerase-like protein